MDRIATLRQIESALSELETGETDLESCERQIRAAVRTFVTEFDGELSAYRSDTGTVVLAASEREARDRIKELTDAVAPTVESIE
jgi:CHASE3 domain sensor protein